MSAPGPVDLRARTATPADTRALAGALAACCRGGDTVLLAGSLGAGKTTFAQGFAAALGVEGPVTSPTFTLVRQYPCGGAGGIRRLLHADVYRLDHLAEVTDLALPELVEGDGVALVEWGDAAAPVLDEGALTVSLTRVAANGDGGEAEPRLIELRAVAAGWGKRAPLLAEALGAWPAGGPG